MKMMLCSLAISASSLLLFSTPAGAVQFGQLNDFEDGTTMDWGNNASTAENVATGGPAGVNDNFLQVTSTGGGGQGSRLTVFNYLQQDGSPSLWRGDYIGQGITAIEVDLRNQGTTNLSIRLAFKLFGNGQPGYLSQAISLAPGSGWQHFSISITASDLIAIDGPPSYAQFFSGGPQGFEEIRFINEVGQSNLNGDPIVGQIGIDNIHAVPEPSVSALAATGLFVVAMRFACKRGRMSRR
jgi:hypothetical protein